MAQNGTNTGDTKEDLAALRKDVDKLLADIGSLADHSASDARGGVRKAARKARASADRAVDKAEDELNEIDDEVRDYIREHPLAACSAAVGVGFLGALLLRR
ncbi:MAG: DUF883 C-terminal domain-containing protein [Oceanicaulis sp.]